MFPALLTSIPLFVLYFFSLNPSLENFLSGLFSLQVASDITISLALLYGFSQLNRFLSKQLFEKKIFSDGLYLPTTNCLLNRDQSFSDEFKTKLHSKIKTDFGIEILAKAEEAKDELKARKIISEAVGQIRSKVVAGRLTEQHNAEYGFVRNLVGGSVASLSFSIINVGVFGLLSYNTNAIVITMVLGFVYLLVLIFSKKVILSFGQHYARILIQEYMAK